jgi:hypothetical protein
MISYPISVKKKKESRYLVLWLLINLMVCESLGRGIGCAKGRRVTPSAPYL